MLNVSFLKVRVFMSFTGMFERIRITVALHSSSLPLGVVELKGPNVVYETF